MSKYYLLIGSLLSVMYMTVNVHAMNETTHINFLIPKTHGVEDFKIEGCHPLEQTGAHIKCGKEKVQDFKISFTQFKLDKKRNVRKERENCTFVGKSRVKWKKKFGIPYEPYVKHQMNKTSGVYCQVKQKNSNTFDINPWYQPKIF